MRKIFELGSDKNRLSPDRLLRILNSSLSDFFFFFFFAMGHSFILKLGGEKEVSDPSMTIRAHIY